MTRPNPPSIPDCDRELWEKGEHIATLDAGSTNAEEWVKKIAAQANARVDWHYFGGRACVRFLGDDAARTRVFEAIEALEGELKGRILRSFGPKDPPAQSYLPLSLFKRPRQRG